MRVLFLITLWFCFRVFFYLSFSLLDRFFALNGSQRSWSRELNNTVTTYCKLLLSLIVTSLEIWSAKDHEARSSFGPEEIFPSSILHYSQLVLGSSCPLKQAWKGNVTTDGCQYLSLWLACKLSLLSVSGCSQCMSKLQTKPYRICNYLQIMLSQSCSISLHDAA